MQSSPLAARPEAASQSDYAPFGQLARMLVPSAGSFAIYDASGELAWCSDGFERPDLRALVEAQPAAAAVLPTGGGVPAFVAPLTAADGTRLGCVVLELAPNARQNGSMIASLLRPVLECLAGRLDLERTMAGTIRAATPSAASPDDSNADPLEQLLREGVQHLACALGALVIPDRGVAAHWQGDPSFAAERALEAARKPLLAWIQLNDKPLIVNRVAAGQAGAHKILACPVRAADQRVCGILALFRQPTSPDFETPDLKLAEYLSGKATAVLDGEQDALTGFANRPLFERRAQRELASGDGRRHALLYVDVDRLQLVNDAFGYHAGDEVLRRVAGVLEAELAAGEFVGRVGGDRFALFLPGLGGDAAAERGRKILEAIAAAGCGDVAPSMPLSACAGVAEAVAGTAPASHLLAAAELACKHAKRFGRGRLRRARESDPLAVEQRNRTLAAAALQEALRSNQLELQSQPIVALRGAGGLVGWEVLLRLRTAGGELLEPEKFFETAERHQLLGALDRWVVCAVAEQLAPQVGALEGSGRRFLVNLSSHSLVDSEFPSFVLAELARTGVPANLLCFEIRESLAAEHLSAAESLAAELARAGCGIALDNCGAGQGSLAELKRLPVQYVKLDGTLVRAAVTDPVAESVLSAAASAARALGVPTIAQHVESAELAGKLRELEIDCGQGFFFGRLEPLTAVLDRLTAPAVAVQGGGS